MSIQLEATKLSMAELRVLEALADYRYLISDQFVRLGISKSRRYLYRVLKKLCDRKRPLINGLDFGALPTIGRLHVVYHLTDRGIQTLEDAGRELETINAPKRVTHFAHDYWHRIACVDVHLTVQQWADANEAHLDFWHAYYDHGTQGEDGRAYVRTRTAWEAGYLIPDAIFQSTTEDGTARLCAFEMHNGPDAGRICRQIAKYREAFQTKALETAHGYPARARLLIGFDTPRTLENTLKRVERDQLLGDHHRQLFMKAKPEIDTGFVEGWHQAPDRKLPLFG